MKYFMYMLFGIAIVGAAVWSSSGCSEQSTQTQKSTLVDETRIGEESLEKTKIIMSDFAESTLEENLSLPAVSAFVDTLEDWGYNYRREESLLMVKDRYRRTLVPEEPVADKVRPDGPYYYELAGADTLIWQVFENTRTDSTLHSALITVCHDGQKRSLFVEADVSSAELEFVRGGVLQPDGELTDTAVARNLWKDYSKCVLACCASAAVLCILTGPAWGGCTALACLDCYPGCVVGIAVMLLLGDS